MSLTPEQIAALSKQDVISIVSSRVKVFRELEDCVDEPSVLEYLSEVPVDTGNPDDYQHDEVVEYLNENPNDVVMKLCGW